MSLKVFFLALCLTICGFCKDYKSSLEEAQLQEKRVLLAFVGSEWCPWSEKLLKEVLKHPEFENALKDLVVFVTVDFPYTGSCPESERLKEKFNVQQLPTVVLASQKEEEIAKIGYLPLTPTEFASHVQRVLDSYKKLVSKIDETDLNQMSIEDLRALYQEACFYNLAKFKERVLSIGLTRDPTPFFLLEKYIEVVKSEPKKAKLLRSQIDFKDPENKESSKFHLAVIDFNALAEISDDTQKVLKPLKKYLKEYGETDRKNCWRIQLMISQYLFHKQQDISKSIKAAKSALESAPEEKKAEILEFLNYITESRL